MPRSTNPRRQARQITKLQNYKRNFDNGKDHRQKSHHHNERGISNKRKRKQSDEELEDEEELQDEEGNEDNPEPFKVGVGSEDEDSDIDSDEAWGESDEERFEDFILRGSSSDQIKKIRDHGKNGEKTNEREEMDLDESEEEDEEGMMDLVQVLDQVEKEHHQGGLDTEARGKKRGLEEIADGEDHNQGEEEQEEEFGRLGDSESYEEGNEEDESDEEGSSINGDSDDGEDEEADPSKIESLHQVISSLTAANNASKPHMKRPRLEDPNEGKSPSDFNITLPPTLKKLTVQDLLPSITDPALKKSLKLLADDKKPFSKEGIAGKLSAPLPKRQQDRLDRAAAYEKTKEALNRWVDTVKHNREVEHLHFPLPDPDGAGVVSTRISASSKPLNVLEATVSNILKQSHLESEKEVAEFEALKTNKMTLEEVQARTTQLRLARELLYREEVKAKRIKKIKSKSWRRIHKKEREKQKKSVKEAMLAEGEIDVEMEDEERERKRAEERMTLRHKQSRWTQGLKESGRAMWDEEARNDAVEMHRRGEELKQRIMGKGVKRDNNDETSSDEESEDDDSFEDEEKEAKRLLKRLEKTAKMGEVDDNGPVSRLMNMKFMKQGEAARKRQNEEMIEQLRKELEWEDKQRSDYEEGSEEEEEEESNILGRRLYKPSLNGRRTSETNRILPETTREPDIDRNQNKSTKDSKNPNGGANSAEEESDVEITINTLPSNPFILSSTVPASTLATGGCRNNIRRNPFQMPPSRHEEVSSPEPTLSSNPWLAPQNSVAPKSLSETTAAVGKQEAKTQKAILKITKDRRAMQKREKELVGGIRDDEIEIDTTATLKFAPLTDSQAGGSVDVASLANEENGWEEEEEGVDVDEGDISLISSINKDKGALGKLINKTPAISLHQKELVKRAFAGDDVVKDFEEEKRKEIEEDQAQEIDLRLPGWGSWVGEGIKARNNAPKRNKKNRSLVKKIEGIDADKRKDAKLKDVIISEKRCKKNAKYMAQSLPHPFETKAQYERSLRIPIGPEWTTKESFQKSTMPRVMVKKGMVIEPMLAPFK